MKKYLCKQNFWVRCLLGIAVSVFALSACTREKPKPPPKIITIQPKAFEKTLYFSGVIEPLKSEPVITPVSGVVTTKFFHYGNEVKKGDLLLRIKSPTRKVNYQNALTSYLKAKHDEKSNLDKYKNTEILYKKGIVSKNDYAQSKTTYLLSHLAFLQSEEKLHEHTDIPAEFKQATLSDIDKIQKMLEMDKKMEYIKLYAPETGLALFGIHDVKKMSSGSSVKKNQTVLYIGDLKGVSLTIKVNEIAINQLKPQQKAIVTSPAFPNIPLQGHIANLDLQATGEGGTPTFTAKIEVPKVTPKQHKLIHIGMNAKIAVILHRKNRILVPLNAVKHRPSGEITVTTVDKTGKHKDMPVTTGETTMDSVEITSGLKVGDKIVIPN